MRSLQNRSHSQEAPNLMITNQQMSNWPVPQFAAKKGRSNKLIPLKTSVQ